MAPWLILFVGAIYLVIAGDLLCHSKPAMAGVFFGYALSNVFLYLGAT